MAHECIEESPAKANEADVTDMKTGELEIGQAAPRFPHLKRDASAANFDANQNI
jgi:hypothetical protein